MKTAILLLSLMCIFGTAYAYEQPGNPDRYPSVGLNWDRNHVKTEYEFAGLKQEDFTKETSNAFIADFRLPMSAWFTVNVHGGYLKTQNDIFTGEEVGGNGYNVGIGVRVYIH